MTVGKIVIWLRKTYLEYFNAEEIMQAHGKRSKKNWMLKIFIFEQYLERHRVSATRLE